MAKYYEWGGLDTTGNNQFNNNRPGWGIPIHDLLVKHKVNAVFHGHDHFFAKQELDGIIYQLVPQPSSTKYGNNNLSKEYGYTKGWMMNAPGYMRIKVEADKAILEYIQTSIDNKHMNKEILFSYSIPNLQ
jgi:hypothetical protein